MATRRYLLGDLKDKKRIEHLMFHRAPNNYTVEFAWVCNEYVAYLDEYDVRNVSEFNATIPEFMEHFEIDVCEMNGYRSNIIGYLSDVQEALGYFLIYLDRLDFLPVPESLKVSEGTPMSVLMFEVEIPKRLQFNFSTMRHL